MRRLLAASALVLTVLALGAWSGSAAAVVCPQASGATPCCGATAFSPAAYRPALVPGGCCPPSCCASSACCAGGAAEPACPLVQLTISSSRNPSSAGLPLTISGRLGNGASGQSVELWQELPGQSAFKRVAQTTTDGSGGYKFVRSLGVVNTNASWYAKAGSAISGTLVEHVRAFVGLAARARSGRVVALSGHVTPGHAGELVTLQQQTAQGWRTIGTVRLGSKSGFNLRHRFAHRGATSLRAVFGGDSRNVRSTSQALSVKVR